MSSSFKRRGKKAAVRPAAAPWPPPSPSFDVEATAQSSSKDHATSSANDKIDDERPNRSPQQRTITSSSLLPGTKPWTNGLTLTSSGLREVDSFFFSSGGGGEGGGGGGGQPLQTSLLLEEDRLSDDLARSLCRCWCAEGVAQRQLVLLGSLSPSYAAVLDDEDRDSYGDYEGSTPEELRDFLLSLPRNLHLDKFRERARKARSSAAAAAGNSDGDAINNNNRESISAIIEEEEDEAGDGDEHDDGATPNGNEGLVNAWQYRKSVQDKRTGIGGRNDGEGANGRGVGGGAEGDGIYCHSYDLSKRMWDQFNSNDDGRDCGDANADVENPLVANAKVIDCSQAFSSSPDYRQQGMTLFCCLWKHLQSTLSKHPNTVIRLFLHRLPIGPSAIAVPLLMSKIRKENLPVVVLATIRPWKWLCPSAPSTENRDNKLDTLASLRNASDVALSLDSFSSFRMPPPPEFSLLQGVLTVRKCASFTSASHYTDSVAWKRPLAERFGVKRDARKVTVQLLHLPPEEYSKGGSSTGGVRSGGGISATAGGGGGDGKDQNKNNSASKGGGCSSLGGGASLEF